MNGNQTSEWIRTLVELIGKKGMESTLIPHYLRVLSHSIFVRPEEGYTELNEHMHHIGWGDIDVDYHLFELAKACLEKSAVRGQHSVSS